MAKEEGDNLGVHTVKFAGLLHTTVHWWINGSRRPSLLCSNANTVWHYETLTRVLCMLCCRWVDTSPHPLHPPQNYLPWKCQSLSVVVRKFYAEAYWHCCLLAGREGLTGSTGECYCVHFYFIFLSQYLSVASEMLASGSNSPIMACDAINWSITHSDTVTVFEPRLKTHLFNAAYN